MNKYVEMINYNLEKFLQGEYPKHLHEAMVYSVKAGGKRMRPLLMLYTAEGFGGDFDDVIPFACALEFIHTYSLIHDDLPCMDNDDFRRGKPTNHKVFGEGMAVLAGDGLLNTAFEIMAKASAEKNNAAYNSAMYEIVKASGISGMIGGQAVDLLSEGKKIDEETLLYIQKTKTAAIIKAALTCGGILSGQASGTVEKVRNLGELLGIAFQIKDDLLDVKSTAEELGKPIGSDAKNEKATYVSLYGIDAAEAEYKRLSLETIEIVESLNLKTEGLALYLNELMNRTF